MISQDHNVEFGPVWVKVFVKLDDEDTQGGSCLRSALAVELMVAFKGNDFIGTNILEGMFFLFVTSKPNGMVREVGM